MAFGKSKRKSAAAKADAATKVVPAERPVVASEGVESSPNTQTTAKAVSGAQVKAPAVVSESDTSEFVYLEQGDSGSDVERLQNALRAKGFRLKVDGQFSLTMKQALIQHQGNLGIARTGAADAATWAALTTEGNK
jgi:peptidoglycan hydrolase-like protein with peptidoglycan-binding domain